MYEQMAELIIRTLKHCQLLWLHGGADISSSSPALDQEAQLSVAGTSRFMYTRFWLGLVWKYFLGKQKQVDQSPSFNLLMVENDELLYVKNIN